LNKLNNKQIKVSNKKMY